MKKLKYYFIALLCFVVLLTSTISAYAADEYVILTNNNLELKLSFNDLSIYVGETWNNVCANSIDEFGKQNYFFIAAEPYVKFAYGFNAKEQDYEAIFQLLYSNGDPVEITDTVALNATYKLSFIEENYGHSLVERENSQYCYEATCEYCGYDELVLHDLEVSERIDPTCSSKGYEIKHCVNDGCGYQTTNIIPKVSHKYINGEYAVKKPTCTDYGTTYTVYCQYCYKYISLKAIEPLGHTISKATSTTQPTCTSAGVRSGPCATCGEVVKVYSDPLGHDWRGATCTDAAVCITCGAQGEPLGHDYKAFGLGKCKNCGQNPAKDTANNVLESVKNVFNSVGDFFKSGYDKVVDAGNNFKDDFNSTLEKITMIIGGIIVVIALIIFLPIVVKVYKKIFRKKEKTTWRGKR